MEKVFDDISTREAFGAVLVQLAHENKNLMYIAADTLKSVGGKEIHKSYPDRALNVGISEQNMILMAAGMAASGAKVFAATYAAFASMRICEQIRTFVAYPVLDVKIAAGLGGLSGGIEGVTHQGTEDIGMMRVIPGMTVVCAADAASTVKITRAIAEYEGPVYLRLGRDPSPKVFDENYKFELGKANILRPSGRVTLLGYGSCIGRCLLAARLLEESGISCGVIETPSLKPFDKEAVIKAAEKSELLATVEDHNIIGGLGSIVLETLAEAGTGTKCIRMGLKDEFGTSGNCEELLDYYGMSPENICRTIKEQL